MPLLRVLTLSTLFPDISRPNFGVFVERQTRGLAAMNGVELKVVSPIGLPPPPLQWHPHYRPLAGLPRHEQWKGLDIYRPRFPHLPVVGTRFSPALMARALLPMLRALQAKFPIDVIDTEFFWPDGPAAIALGKALNAPVSIKARGSDIHYWSKHTAIRRKLVGAAHAADGMLAVSAALKRDMVALGMPERAIDVHYTGVDLDQFGLAQRMEAKQALGRAGPLVITVGHLRENKGQQLVLEAIRAIPQASLLIIGEGPLRPALEAQIAEHGLGDRVMLTGAVSHDALPGLFAAADVSVLASASEGLANVWVESIASGTPVVTCDVGGAREIVDGAVAGRITARNPAAIAQAIRELLADPPDRQETRKAAARFTWDANTQALHAHLARLVERHQRRGDPAILTS